MIGESFDKGFNGMLKRLRSPFRRQVVQTPALVNIGCLTIRLQMLNDGTMTKEQFREPVTPRESQDGGRTALPTKTKGRK